MPSAPVEMTTMTPAMVGTRARGRRGCEFVGVTMGRFKELQMLLSEYTCEEIADLKARRDAAIANEERCPLSEREKLALIAHELYGAGADERWIFDPDD
jgi:hypothetical protein